MSRCVGNMQSQQARKMLKMLVVLSKGLRCQLDETLSGQQWANLSVNNCNIQQHIHIHVHNKDAETSTVD